MDPVCQPARRPPQLRRPDEGRRKLIVFTEHRDTLNYLVERLRTRLGRPDVVVTIHGGTKREDRRGSRIEQRATATARETAEVDARAVAAVLAAERAAGRVPEETAPPSQTGRPWRISLIGRQAGVGLR